MWLTHFRVFSSLLMCSVQWGRMRRGGIKTGTTTAVPAASHITWQLPSYSHGGQTLFLFFYLFFFLIAVTRLYSQPFGHFSRLERKQRSPIFFFFSSPFLDPRRARVFLFLLPGQAVTGGTECKCAKLRVWWNLQGWCLGCLLAVRSRAEVMPRSLPPHWAVRLKRSCLWTRCSQFTVQRVRSFYTLSPSSFCQSSLFSCTTGPEVNATWAGE